MTRIIDAETIALDDGSEVRLTGTLAPRRPLTSLSDAPWPPEQAAKAALASLVLGRSVEVSAAGGHSDRYGRRVAHVFMQRDGERVWVQGELLSLGHARVYALTASAPCVGAMLALERAAREAGRGLWSNAAYALRRAARAHELSGLRSTYQIVEGRVANVSEVRGAIYLNFGAEWRRDFTAGVLKRHKVLAGASGQALDSKALLGKRVRVRGWIERRNGPFIEIVHPAQIEILDGDRLQDAPAAATFEPDRDAKEKRPAVLPGAHEL